MTVGAQDDIVHIRQVETEVGGVILSAAKDLVF
jgi:hypothetical protein